MIGGNNGDGVQIVNGSHDTLVTRNYIGTNISATATLSNSLSGVSILSGAYNTRVGDGTNSGRNVIAGNGAYGVYITGTTTTSNTIAYDDIGINSAALANGSALPANARDALAPAIDPALPSAPNLLALPNHGNGVTIQGGASGNVITASTWIARNAASGVWVTGGANHNVIQNTAVFNNAFYGVLFEGLNTNDNAVNSDSLYTNGYDGIGERGGATHNYWSHVSIYNNGGLGIDKDASSDLTNIPTGPFPVITKEDAVAGIITGTASATSGAQATTVEVYRVAPDPSGCGEGRTYVGSAATDLTGRWSLPVTPGPFVCYTAFETVQSPVTTGPATSSEFGPNNCRTFLPELQR